MIDYIWANLQLGDVSGQRVFVKSIWLIYISSWTTTREESCQKNKMNHAKGFRVLDVFNTKSLSHLCFSF